MPSVAEGPYGQAQRAKLAAAVAAGELEPTKTRTTYACPAPECGKCSIYTGDLGPDRLFDYYNSRFCSCCGAEMVEEGPKRFIIEFESVSALTHPEVYDWRTERARGDVDPLTIPEDWWTPQRRQDSEHSIRQQFDGLQKLIAEGEFIRNVRVLEVPEQPVGVDVTEQFAMRAFGGGD